MQKIKDSLFFVLLGIILTISVLFSTGYTANPKTTDNKLNFCCSSNGEVVYVKRDNKLFMSENFGKKWINITPDTSNKKDISK